MSKSTRTTNVVTTGHGTARRLRRFVGAAAVLALPLLVATTAAGASQRRTSVGAVSEISRGCRGQNAEAEQAVDGRFVYVTWIGCDGVGFARSTNGGRSFTRPMTVPDSIGHGAHHSGIGSGLPKYGWDPSIAVARDHTVYVAYMLYRHSRVHPMVAVSADRGASFARVSHVPSPGKNNWGDRDFVAVGPNGTLYLTWDYGPSLKTRHGNIVVQRSTNRGRTWSRISVVTPGYPDHGGAVAGPLVVEPSGRIDIAFWVLAGGAEKPPALPAGHIYFTSSTTGRTWSAPVAIRPRAGRIGPFVTWIDVDLALDRAGNLYATWDTQRPGGDVGWLSYSSDHGRTWSAARRVTPDHDNAEHIMAVTAGPRGTAYVGWLSDNSAHGFAQYVRAFSIRAGWRTGPLQVSRQFGNRNIWPGDTIGISMLPSTGNRPHTVQLSWGSAVNGSTSEIFGASAAP